MRINARLVCARGAEPELAFPSNDEARWERNGKAVDEGAVCRATDIDTCEAVGRGVPVARLDEGILCARPRRVCVPAADVGTDAHLQVLYSHPSKPESDSRGGATCVGVAT